MHFVPSHSVQQTMASAAVQKAASHGEQMPGPQQASLQAQEPQQAQHAQQEAQHAQQEAQHAQQGQQGLQQPAQPEQRQTNAKRTFQEILREQLQVCGPCVFDVPGVLAVLIQVVLCNFSCRAAYTCVQSKQ